MVHGTLAQLVEQRTENPCVPGSIPGGTTNSEFYQTRSFFITCSNNLFLVSTGDAKCLLEDLFWLNPQKQHDLAL